MKSQAQDAHPHKQMKECLSPAPCHLATFPYITMKIQNVLTHKDSYKKCHGFLNLRTPFFPPGEQFVWHCSLSSQNDAHISASKRQDTAWKTISYKMICMWNGLYQDLSRKPLQLPRVTPECWGKLGLRRDVIRFPVFWEKPYDWWTDSSAVW